MNSLTGNSAVVRCGFDRECGDNRVKKSLSLYGEIYIYASGYTFIDIYTKYIFWYTCNKFL